MAERLDLVQLPIPQPAKFSPTGNVPLAAGCLAVATRAAGVPFEVRTLDTAVTDELGDTGLADRVAQGEPRFVGLSLYLWNTERSLHLAREIKRRSPATTILLGGPEVGPDNPFVLDEPAFDVAVCGEAEESLPRVLDALVRGGDLSTLPGVAVRTGAGLSQFSPARAPDFALDRFPSPYLAGALAVDPRRATYVETVRGCRSHCTFCFYPRSSAVLRVLDVAATRRQIEALRDAGAREIVFLDPTFNHRPGFEELLESLADLNADRRLRFFAEVRAEGLKEAHADLLAQAGFHKLEIGLQSVNPAALAHSRRGGSKEQVAAAARMLKARGIDLLVDLIVGLPHDTRDDVRKGVEFLAENGLASSAQVFALSVLPGTRMRATAAEDGIEFDACPPYRVQRTRTMSRDDIDAALLEAEDVLDRRLDEMPRPFLCDASPTNLARDVFMLDTDRADAAMLTRLREPGAQHATLWIEGNDLWAKRELSLATLKDRFTVDPFATLDVVLAPRVPFPLDLVAYLRRAMREPERLVAVERADRPFPADYLDALRAEIPVYREMRFEDALRRARDLGESLPAARIVGPVPDRDAFRDLAERCYPEDVAFADRALERRWVEEALRYRE